MILSALPLIHLKPASRPELLQAAPISTEDGAAWSLYSDAAELRHCFKKKNFMVDLIFFQLVERFKEMIEKSAPRHIANQSYFADFTLGLETKFSKLEDKSRR